MNARIYRELAICPSISYCLPPHLNRVLGESLSKVVHMCNERQPVFVIFWSINIKWNNHVCASLCWVPCMMRCTSIGGPQSVPLTAASDSLQSLWRMILWGRLETRNVFSLFLSASIVYLGFRAMNGIHTSTGCMVAYIVCIGLSVHLINASMNKKTISVEWINLPYFAHLRLSHLGSAV